MDSQIDEEEPLDPVMEKVRVKMVRLLGISIGLMLLALITVLGAVVYKISQTSQENAAESENSNLKTIENSAGNVLESLEIALPEGVNITSSSLSNNNLMLRLLMKDGAEQFWIVNLQTGNVVSRIKIK